MRTITWMQVGAILVLSGYSAPFEPVSPPRSVLEAQAAQPATGQYLRDALADVEQAYRSHSSLTDPQALDRYYRSLLPNALDGDIPVYRTSFEDLGALSAAGITSGATIAVAMDNVGAASGNRSLAVSGILPGAQWSSVDVDVSMSRLIQRPSIDLSDKTIGYSYFVPADEVGFVDGVALHARSGGIEVILAGGVREYGLWYDLQVDVAALCRNRSWLWTNGTADQALDAIRHCETLRFSGGRSTAGPERPIRYWVDNLNWIRSDRMNQHRNDAVDSLRRSAADEHFAFGLCAAHHVIFGPENDPHGWTGDAWYAYLAVQEGAVDAVQHFGPRPDEDYGNPDLDPDPAADARALLRYRFGEAYGMSFLGYGVGWMYGEYAPQWIRDLSFPAQTQALLSTQVRRDLHYTLGRRPIWILFNETIGGVGGGRFYLRNRRGTGWDYSPWSANDADSSLIAAAFAQARSVDPGAVLIINDYAVEQMGEPKADYLYRLATGLKNRRVPIDGVGFQFHYALDPNGNVLREVYSIGSPTPTVVSMSLDEFFRAVDANVRRYARAGLQVAFTEVEGQIEVGDIDLTTAAGRAEYDRRCRWQAAYFAGLLRIARANPNVPIFHIWGVTDRYQNGEMFPGYGNGFCFDRNYYPKPAYYAMLDVLQSP